MWLQGIRGTSRHETPHGVAADVWSCSIRQPSGVRFINSVNNPVGASSARISFQRPNTSTSRRDKGRISINSNCSRPICSRVA